VALILKSDPGEIRERVFTSSLLWIYQGCEPQQGDEMFVWTSQTAAGVGLAIRGRFSDWSLRRLPNKFPGAIVRVSIVAQRPDQPLTISDLRPYDKRTSPSSAWPLRALADTLLLDARNKIARIDHEVAEYLDSRFNADVARDSHPGFSEGDPRFRQHLARERNIAAVRQKKANAPRPLICEICTSAFSYSYNNADAVIECHHLLPLGVTGNRITRLDDLILLCANCHRAVHAYMNNHPDDPRTQSSASLQQVILHR
jgi:hypothetical protein